MSGRHIVVVDVETTGLDPERHTTVEVAWWNLNTGERGEFVPPHLVSEALRNAQIEALRVNRYIDRLATAEQDYDGTAASKLSDLLEGSTLAGSNPAFDAGFLTVLYREMEAAEKAWAPRWHHRLLDLSAYAAGVLLLPPNQLPGLSTVCELLGVENTAPHTAAGDVDATGRCFLALFERAGVSLDGAA